MRNEQVGQSKLLLEISQQIDDLRLDRDVQRGDRFVCNNKFWFKRQRPRDTGSSWRDPSPQYSKGRRLGALAPSRRPTGESQRALRRSTVLSCGDSMMRRDPEK